MVDPKFGALHDVRGQKLVLGPPKTPASAREVHLPPFLAEELLAHRKRNPDSRRVELDHGRTGRSGVNV